MSNRSMTSAAQTQAASSVKSFCQLAEFDFSGGVVYVCNHVRNIVWGGNTYTAVGGMGQASQMEESSDLSAKPMTFSLAGVDATNIAIALNQNYIGRTCRLYLVFLDSNDQVVLDPVLMFSGLMDTMPIEIGEKTATISITAEGIFARWQTPKTRRVNDANQTAYAKSLNPSQIDLGCQYVAENVNKTLIWGGKNAQA